MAEHEGRLSLTREIARSGIATVWEGYDTGLGRKVLVKSVHPQYAQDSDLRTRFEREARAIARLSHDNVVRIYDLRSDATELSLILEYVEGSNLGRLLKDRGALPPEIAVTIAVEILNGLEQAHAAGIIHRDLKPDNVLVSDRGEVKITDFGLASLKDLPTVTQEGMVVGTPAYMAPEQAEGGDISAATDIFALGLMLFEMLTGERIHKGTALAETFQSVLRYQPPKLEDYSETISAGLQPVLRRMLERNPAKRPAGAAEAREALLAAQPEGVLPKALIADFLSGSGVRKLPASTTSRTRRKPRALRLASMILLGVLGVVVIFKLASLLTLAPDTAKPPSEPVSKDTTAVQAESTVVQTPQETNPDSAERQPEGEQNGDIAGRVTNPPTGPRADTTVSAGTAAGPGWLDLQCRPWAQIFLRDSLLGATPLPAPLKMPSGTYELVLLNPEIGLPISTKAVVVADRTTELRINLFDHVARIRIAAVKPWADVYINGSYELRTPSSKVIFRPLGTYTLSLRNPDFPAYTDTLTFRGGEPMREIRVDLSRSSSEPKPKS